MDSNGILETMTTAIVLVDAQLRINYLNTAAIQLLGGNRQRLLSSSLLDNVAQFTIAKEALIHAASSGQSLSINSEQWIIADGRSHTIDLVMSAFNPANKLSLIELRLVDQQKRIYQQSNQDAQQQAAQYLVRNLAHEIKNPLSGVRGAAQLLDRELQHSDQQLYTKMIIEQADRLRNLVDRLLGPQKPMRYQAHNIHQVVEKVLALVSINLPNKIKLKRDYDPSIPEVSMDSEQIQQALLNLVQNAIQALHQAGGMITLRTRTRHQMTIGNTRHKMVSEITVLDDGPGVPSALLDTLFYPMVTGREQGTGLGLSIAEQIAKSHQGRIDCQSVPGATQFHLYLPITL